MGTTASGKRSRKSGQTAAENSNVVSAATARQRRNSATNYVEAIDKRTLAQIAELCLAQREWMDTANPAARATVTRLLREPPVYSWLNAAQIMLKHEV